MKTSVVVIGKQSVWDPAPKPAISSDKFVFLASENQYMEKTNSLKQQLETNNAQIQARKQSIEQRMKMLVGDREKIEGIQMKRFKSDLQRRSTINLSKDRSKSQQTAFMPILMQKNKDLSEYQASSILMRNLQKSLLHKIALNQTSSDSLQPIQNNNSQIPRHVNFQSQPSPQQSSSMNQLKRMGTLLPKQKMIFSSEAAKIRKQAYQKEVFDIKKKKFEHKVLVELKLKEIQENDEVMKRAKIQNEEALKVIEESHLMRDGIRDQSENYRQALGEDRYQFYDIQRPAFDFWNIQSMMKHNRRTTQVDIQSPTPNLHEIPIKHSFMRRQPKPNNPIAPYQKRTRQPPFQIPTRQSVPQHIMHFSAEREFNHNLMYSSQNLIQKAMQGKLFKELVRVARSEYASTPNNYLKNKNKTQSRSQSLLRGDPNRMPNRKYKRFDAKNYDVSSAQYFTKEEELETIQEHSKTPSVHPLKVVQDNQLVKQQEQTNQNDKQVSHKENPKEQQVTNKLAEKKQKMVTLEQGKQETFSQNTKIVQKTAYTYKSGAVYKGEWKGNYYRHGFGEMEWPDGTVYKGEFKEGKAHGNGKFVAKSGDIFEGNFVSNAPVGAGQYQCKSMNTIYEGNWNKYGKPQNEGVESWQDKKGEVYSTKVYQNKYCDQVYKNDQFNVKEPGHKQAVFFNNYLREIKFDKAADFKLQHVQSQGNIQQKQTVDRLFAGNSRITRNNQQRPVTSQSEKIENSTKKKAFQTPEQMQESINRLTRVNKSQASVRIRTNLRPGISPFNRKQNELKKSVSPPPRPNQSNFSRTLNLPKKIEPQSGQGLSLQLPGVKSTSVQRTTSPRNLTKKRNSISQDLKVPSPRNNKNIKVPTPRNLSNKKLQFHQDKITLKAPSPRATGNKRVPILKNNFQASKVPTPRNTKSLRPPSPRTNKNLRLPTPQGGLKNNRISTPRSRKATTLPPHKKFVQQPKPPKIFTSVLTH